MQSFPRPPSPKTSLFEGGGPPAGGGRSSRPSPVEGVPAHRAPYHSSRTLSTPLIQPRVQGRNPARFNGGYGVPRGFKGEKSKFPPNPLGLAERVPRIARRLCNRPPSPLPKDLPLRGRGDRPQAVEGVLPHSVESVYALNPHSILTAYSGCNSFAPKPSIFQPTVEIWSSGSAVPALPAGLTITRGFAPLRLVTP